ncbi:MAG TPA: hypothetical protein VFI98_06750 [Pseudolabrys sp.]|jgi:hypothetical protein|nr:hypothetical protein [Pseudolabrys sp.]
MRKTFVTAMVVSALVAPAQAQNYPVSGKWGESSGSKPGAIDCTSSSRVIEFNGDQRTDSNGGVPSYRNKSVSSDGASSYRVVDEFSTGQISAGQSAYTLRKVDPDHIEMNMDGGSVKLQRCK